ncbi:MAG: methionine--tRNA ligase, partial [Alphaproteobacteria bacterium]
MARILITSALPYVNGVKHLGNLVGSMLPADVYARFARARGHEVLYICATDEHGTPTELAAAAAGKPVEEFSAEWHETQKRLGVGFGLSWNYFGRTSAKENHILTQHFADRLDDNGLIEERVTKQIYSVDDKRFLPDRYVVGTCPHCGYENARGDQCENCTRVLDPTDLINPRSAVSGSTNLEVRDSKHLFLRQSQLVDRLRAWIGEKKDWPHLVTSIANKWLDEGLRDRGITRDLYWGVPVPHDNRWTDFQGKVFYVWFDAPIGYISATWEWAKATGGDWESWWREDKGAKDVRYIEFMGKDNVPFHTVGFPVTILGSGEPWKLADYIKGVNWLNYYGDKFSTSQKRGIFMDQALEILPADYWRWYLMSNAPEGSDSNFTWQHFQSVVNKDLADVFGNFVNRILRFAKARFGETVPQGGEPGPLEEKLFADLDSRFKQYTDYLEAMEFRKAAAELRALWVLGNEYLTEAAPWTVIKTDKDKAAQAVRLGINLIHFFAHAACPFIPDTALKVHEAVNGRVELLPWLTDPIREELSTIKAGDSFSVPDVLF